MQHVHLPFQAERPGDFPLNPGIRSEKRRPISVPQDRLEERETRDQQPKNAKRSGRLRRTEKLHGRGSGSRAESFTAWALFFDGTPHSCSMTKLVV